MRKKQINKSKSLKRYVLIGTFMIGSAILFFNDFGFLNYLTLKEKHHQLRLQLQGLLTQQSKLRQDIIKLQTDQDYIQKIAREKYMFALPGEKIYRVEDEKKIIHK